MTVQAVLVIHARADVDETWLASHVEAARISYPQMDVMAQRGPSGDPSAFRGRDVVIWPWLALQSSVDALRPFAAVVARTAKRVRMIAPAEKEDRIGPADLNGHEPVEWARARCVEVQAAPADDLDAEWFGGDEPAPVEMLEETCEHVADWEPPLDMIEDRPTPTDIFETFPVPPLPRDAAPWAIADYIFDQSAMMGTDPGILALDCLVVLAGCADDAIQAQPKQYEYRWRESARIWGAVVAGPAEKKSPPLRRATAHLRQIDMKLAEEVSQRLEFYERDRAEYERLRAKAKGAPIAMDPPQRPKERCLMVDDATTEALGKILRDNPRGLLQVRDELSGWFGSLDAYSGADGKDGAFYLECYEGGPGKVSRITRDAGPIPNKSLCILGGIQPDPMRKIAHRLKEDGLLQRFIIVCPTVATGLGEDRPPSREAEEAYTAVMERILAERGDKDKPVVFTAEARKLLLDVSIECEAIAKRASTPARMRVHLGKWQGLFVRLCLLYHLIEAAALGQSCNESEVSRGTAETVRRLMMEYLLPHLSAFYSNVLDESSAIEHARWIAGHILAHGKTYISVRGITRAYHPWKRLIPNERRDTMGMLVDAAWLDIDGRGWSVNPLVHELFAERAAAEKTARETARKNISNIPAKYPKNEKDE